MKKSILKMFLLLSAGMTALMVSSCVEPDPIPVGPDPVLEVTVKSVTETTAELGLNIAALEEVAYVLATEEGDYSNQAVVFATGVAVDTSAVSLKITDLEANKKYWVYFAAKINKDDYYDNVVSVDFTTSDYVFDKMLTLVDTEYQGYKIRVTVPEEVRKEPKKYGIRYNFGSLLDVFMTKYEMGRTWAVSLMENGHGCMGWQETQRDTTVYINPWNQNRQNPDGSYYVDPDTGEELMLHTPIAPGEPYIFIAGQYRYGHLDETGWGWSYGQESKDWGYYVPLWDEAGWIAEYGDAPKKSNLIFDSEAGTVITGEEKYWEDNSFGENGTLQVLYFKTKEPDLLETDFQVVIEDVSPIDATISFLTDENTYCYSYVICSDSMYQTLVNDLLLGHEEWMQWLVCSYYGMRQLYFPTLQGDAQVNARDFNGIPLDAENLYHVLITVTGDEQGSRQKFIHETFETVAKTKEAPVIQVTAVEDGQNEYFAKFNIKAPNKDVIRAYYAADYKREFMLEANSGTDYKNLCQNPFSEEELEKINSDEGLEIQINSTDGQIIRMAVLGYNDEETSNDLYSPEKTGKPCVSVADCSTKLLALVPAIDNKFFETLPGVWTANTTVMVREYDANNEIQEFKQNISFKVEIRNTIETPVLTQDIYDLYADLGHSKEAVDGFYEDFKREAEIFNKYRLTYRNRLLCMGWDDYDPYAVPGRLETKTPFDLFTWNEYSSIDNAQIFYDFGPKWYIEIDKEGNVFVPFDQWETPPMVNWQSSVFFMAGYNSETNHGYKSEVANAAGDIIMPAEFPVTVVNNDKIIIKPAMASVTDEAGAETYPHYPNAIGGWGEADASLIRPIVAEITLTRGWDEPEEETPARSARRNYVEQINVSGEAAAPVVVKSVTPIKNIEVRSFEKKQMYVLTEEMFEESIRNYRK